MFGESIYAPSLCEVLCVLSLPHLLFVYIWFAPKSFQRLVKPRDAVAVFAATAWALKGARALPPACARAVTYV